MIETKILDIYNRSGLSRMDFAAKLGISNAVLSHITSGRNKASLDLVTTILHHFPEISADWLLLDKGDMLRNELSYNPDKIKKSLLSGIDGVRQAANAAAARLDSLEREVRELE